MRELKFRAWVLDKKMVRVNTFQEYVLCMHEQVDGRYDFRHREVIIMQYTGLKDKNGKDIYEGDILRSTPIKDVIFEVLFGWNGDSNAWGWCFKWKSNKVYSMDDACERMEVVGNIYENPELIKE